jgi:aminocarboxymuconate-semialdehyde decarboxylase
VVVLIISPNSVAAQEALDGTRKLVSSQRTNQATGATTDTLGPRPQGFIMYSREEIAIAGGRDLTTRRGFLKRAGAGVIFCSCGLLRAARGENSGQRLPVTVAGKRVRTIDVHAHCQFQEVLALMGDQNIVRTASSGAQNLFLVVDERLRSMDEQAIDMEVLSITPFWYRTDRDVATKIVELQNAKLAELCAAHPDRFAAFGSIALQFPDLAALQLETAMKKYNLRGAAIGASVNGEAFSDPKFHPVWAKAEELGAVLFIHPQGTPELAKKLAGSGYLTNTIGYPLDTTIALQHLIFEGTLDRHPGLKVLSAHGGGFFPSYAPRSDHGCFISPKDCPTPLKKKPTEYLNQLYFDSLVFTSEALRHLVAQVGASQIMLGTDNPFTWEGHPVDHVFATTTLSDEDRVAILGTNAERLLGMTS